MIKSSKELVEEALNIFEENSTKNGIIGVPSGFKKLDELTYGWQPGELIIIGGRPGMGKTAFALSMIRNIAVQFNQAVAVFSLGKSSVQIITRMISSETGIPSGKLRKGNLEPYEWEMLNMKLDNLSNSPIYIDDTSSLSIADLKTKVSKLVTQQNVKLIIIDYLQLMTNNDLTTNREEEIASISRNLKILAKELNISIITLSQLSRDIELRGGSKRPMLSDLLRSGAIEQNADIVMFLYRPDYYGFTEWDDEEHTPCEGQAELMVAKHKNGGLDNIRLKFTGYLAKFSNLE